MVYKLKLRTSVYRMHATWATHLHLISRTTFRSALFWDITRRRVVIVYRRFASCGNCLPTFRDNVSVPSSRVKSQGLLMRPVPFWDITRRRVVIAYRRFGTTYRSHLQGSRVPRTLERGASLKSKYEQHYLPGRNFTRMMSS
jgi:hypothetical protein